MHILTFLTYYRPHYSGLTIYAERLARALVVRGHQVTVLTSRYDRSLLAREKLDGVEIIRPYVLMHISKGVLMPTMFYWAWRYVRHADVVHLHLPQLDAAYIALISRLLDKPVVLTYHCDLHLPSGIIHALANQVSHLADHVSARLADVMVTNTSDYAENTDFLRQYMAKMHPIFPPVELPATGDADVHAFRQKALIEPGQRIIGMAGRLAAEKGVEYLVEAMPQILAKHPTARVLYMGQYENVLGEELYAQKLAPLIQKLGSHWTFLGILSPVEAAVFFRECEVTVLPSINSTESFGMVQVESMTCGTPVVATDLPGVRQPVKMTGMGRTVPPMDAASLAQAIIDVLDHPSSYHGTTMDVTQRFSPQCIAEEYEQVFQEVIRGRKVSK